MAESDTMKAVPGAVRGMDPRVPWWWNAAATFLVKIALPVLLMMGMIGFFIWERITTLRDFSEMTRGMIRVVERTVPVLERLEKRLGIDPER